MHGTAGEITSKTKGTWLVGDKGQGRGLTWVGFDRNVITIHVESMYHISADELDGYGVTWVDFKFGGRIGKLSRVNPKSPLLIRNGWNCQGRERHRQSCHRKEEKRETKAHEVRECWRVRTWNRSRQCMPWHLAGFSPP